MLIITETISNEESQDMLKVAQKVITINVDYSVCFYDVLIINLEQIY